MCISLHPLFSLFLLNIFQLTFLCTLVLHASTDIFFLLLFLLWPWLIDSFVIELSNWLFVTIFALINVYWNHAFDSMLSMQINSILYINIYIFCLYTVYSLIESISNTPDRDALNLFFLIKVSKKIKS